MRNIIPSLTAELSPWKFNPCAQFQKCWPRPLTPCQTLYQVPGIQAQIKHCSPPWAADAGPRQSRTGEGLTDPAGPQHRHSGAGTLCRGLQDDFFRWAEGKRIPDSRVGCWCHGQVREAPETGGRVHAPSKYHPWTSSAITATVIVWGAIRTGCSRH